MTIHEEHIKRTYHLARQAQANGDHPFGAILVIGGEVVLECLNMVNSSGDVTRHAELGILQVAASMLEDRDFARATLYASTEPCAMCAGAIYWSGVARLVYGCPAGVLGKIAGGSFVVPCRELFSKGKRVVEVIGPVLSEEGAAIHRGFWGLAAHECNT